MGSFCYVRFQSKSLNGLANYLEQPRLDWGRALRTCCTSLQPLELAADYLYSFDQQQRRLARAVGLKVN